jgi:NAD(P)-dependent dehydrogenase (short-subunit alcohol dehydrogenase family)
MSLENKTLLLTGGTSGIGAACARHFASLGANLYIASNQPEAGQSLESELVSAGHSARFLETDVSDETSVQNLIQTIETEAGHLHAVHCNAGVWDKGKVTDFTDAQWEKLMGVNVKAAFYLAKHAVPLLEKTAAADSKLTTFLITTSVAANIGFPEHALYCASKAALEALVRCLAVDHAGKIRALALSPGTIDTPMLAASCQGWDKPVADLYAAIEKRIPVRRLGQPEDIAKAAAFLLSNQAEYINGTTLTIDGGTSPLPPW